MRGRGARRLRALSARTQEKFTGRPGFPGLSSGMWVWITLLFAAGLAAQDYRGQVAPEPAARSAAAVEFNRFRFLVFSFGREGPSDIPLRGTPVQGREYFAEADLSGIGAAASVRFEVTDTAGRTLRTLTMWKATDSATDGEFHGFVNVPAQPFRIVAAGLRRDFPGRAAGHDATGREWPR